jgi:hypothetical protein
MPADTKDLPQIYRPSQIPVSILLKNYLYLLAQDRKNLFILVMGVLMLLLTIRFSWNNNHSMPVPSEQIIVPDVSVSSPILGMDNFAQQSYSLSSDKASETSLSMPVLEAADPINSDNMEPVFDGKSKLEHGGEQLDGESEEGEGDGKEAATHLERSDDWIPFETEGT